ncbi:MAG: hypothetical protein WB795_12555, partial [Candidatus Acidiferrales bacterium]
PLSTAEILNYLQFLPPIHGASKEILLFLNNLEATEMEVFLLLHTTSGYSRLDAASSVARGKLVSEVSRGEEK